MGAKFSPSLDSMAQIALGKKHDPRHHPHLMLGGNNLSVLL